MFFRIRQFYRRATLTVAGVATLRLVTRPSQMPPLFGVQQLIEGLIWLWFGKRSTIDDASLTLVYWVISHVLWSIYVAFGVGPLGRSPGAGKRWPLAKSPVWWSVSTCCTSSCNIRW